MFAEIRLAISYFCLLLYLSISLSFSHCFLLRNSFLFFRCSFILCVCNIFSLSFSSSSSSRFPRAALPLDFFFYLLHFIFIQYIQRMNNWKTAFSSEIVKESWDHFIITIIYLSLSSNLIALAARIKFLYKMLNFLSSLSIYFFFLSFHSPGFRFVWRFFFLLCVRISISHTLNFWAAKFIQVFKSHAYKLKGLLRSTLNSHIYSLSFFCCFFCRFKNFCS